MKNQELSYMINVITILKNMNLITEDEEIKCKQEFCETEIGDNKSDVDDTAA